MVFESRVLSLVGMLSVFSGQLSVVGDCMGNQGQFSTQLVENWMGSEVPSDSPKGRDIPFLALRAKSPAIVSGYLSLAVVQFFKQSAVILSSLLCREWDSFATATQITKITSIIKIVAKK